MNHHGLQRQETVWSTISNLIFTRRKKYTVGSVYWMPADAIKSNSFSGTTAPIWSVAIAAGHSRVTAPSGVSRWNSVYWPFIPLFIIPLHYRFNRAPPIKGEPISLKVSATIGLECKNALFRCWR